MDFNISSLLESISKSFGSSLPRVLGAIVVLFIGLFIARIIRRLVKKGLQSTGIDSKIDPNNSTKFSLAESLSKIIYWVVLIFLFLTVLNMMGVSGALEPLQDMIGKITGFLPNILGAGLVGFVGYMFANIGKEAVGMAEPAFNRLAAKADLDDDFNIIGIIKQVVFIIILVPIILVALNILDIDMISDPAKNMINKLMDAIPNIIAAAIVLFVFTFIGRFVRSFLTELFDNLKLDHKVNEMGIGNILGQGKSVSKLLANVAFYLIIFFGLMTAVDYLGFEKLSHIFDELLDLTGRIIFGGIILLIGNRISSFVAGQLEASDKTLASIARFATLGLFLAIGLKYMGIADDIVNLAFGLILGAIAVAFALSFGLGGREAAGEQMKKFFNRFNK